MPRCKSPVTYAVLPCAVVLVAGGGLVGCGGGSDDEPLPSGTIARVGDREVTKEQYDRLLKFQYMRLSRQLTNGTLFEAQAPKLIPFSPPFTECVSRSTAAIPKDQRAAITEEQVSQVCRGIPAQAKNETVQQLLSTEVLRQVAQEREITVSDEEVTKALPAAYEQEIGGEANLAKFRTMTGLDVQDFRALVRQSLTYSKVTQEVAEDAGAVTDADVRADYDRNKAKYGRPETRELHVVVAKDEAGARAARSELEGGATFASVVQKHAADEESKAGDGKLSGVAKGQLEQAADAAAFSVGPTELAGPVKGERGWYVIRVDKVTPSRPVAFDRVKGILKDQLQQTKPQRAVASFQEDVQKRWTARTTCAEGYAVAQLCKNGPKPTATTTAAAPATGQ